MRRQDSAVSDAANSKTDVNNLDEFPSLGTWHHDWDIIIVTNL
jgi:hypothetical protein